METETETETPVLDPRPDLGSVWHHPVTAINVCVTDVVERKNGPVVKAMREDGRIVEGRLGDWALTYRPGPSA